LIHKHIHLTIYQPLYWRIGRYVDIIHVRLYLWNMYMNICTYMLQQMQLMCTETPCFGENQRTQKSPKIPGNVTFSEVLKNNLCSYLSLFIGCWNIRENLDSDLFWAGDGRFCGDFPPFQIAFWRNGSRVDTFFIALKNCIFLRRIFWPN